MKKVLGFLCILAVAFAGYSGYVYYKTGSLPFQKKAVSAQAAAAAQIVDVITAARQEITPTASFVAKIESRENVGLRARVTGFLQETLFYYQGKSQHTHICFPYCSLLNIIIQKAYYILHQ